MQEGYKPVVTSSLNMLKRKQSMTPQKHSLLCENEEISVKKRRKTPIERSVKKHTKTPQRSSVKFVCIKNESGSTPTRVYVQQDKQVIKTEMVTPHTSKTATPQQHSKVKVKKELRMTPYKNGVQLGGTGDGNKKVLVVKHEPGNNENAQMNDSATNTPPKSDIHLLLNNPRNAEDQTLTVAHEDPVVEIGENAGQDGKALKLKHKNRKRNRKIYKRETSHTAKENIAPLTKNGATELKKQVTDFKQDNRSHWAPPPWRAQPVRRVVAVIGDEIVQGRDLEDCIRAMLPKTFKSAVHSVPDLTIQNLTRDAVGMVRECKDRMGKELKVTDIVIHFGTSETWERGDWDVSDTVQALEYVRDQLCDAFRNITVWWSEMLPRACCCENAKRDMNIANSQLGWTLKGCGWKIIYHTEFIKQTWKLLSDDGFHLEENIGIEYFARELAQGLQQSVSK